MTERDGGANVVLHIGTMKSGTSYLQAVLRRNTDELRDNGVLVAEEMGPATVDVLERRNVAKKSKVTGAWERFLNLVEAWDGHLVVASQEFLSGATAEEAAMVIGTFVERSVRVVVTCRDLLRVVPSHWQTVIKNGGTVTFADYTRLLLTDDEEDQHRYATGFWRHHDVPAIVEAWAGAVGMENVVVVTVPPLDGPPDVLWRRFAQAAGLPSFDGDLSATAKSNVSLTYAETEMLRQVNTEIRKPLNQAEYRMIVNKYLANKVLRQSPESDRPADRPADRPSFGRDSHERIRERAEAIAEGVAGLGVTVVGDIDELRVAPYGGPEDRQDSTGPRDPIPGSVVVAITKLVTRLARAEREVKRLRRGRSSGTRGRVLDEEFEAAEADDDDAQE